MSIDKDTAADEFGRTFSNLLKASRLVPDLVEVWRAVVTDQQRRFRDEPEAEAQWDEEAADGRDTSRRDPLAWLVRANTLLLSSNIRYGLNWQRLVSKHLPTIRRCLEDFRAEADPLPEVRSELIDQIRIYLQEAAELVSDHGRHLQQEIEQLSRELLPDEPERCADADGKLPRRHRTIP